MSHPVPGESYRLKSCSKIPIENYLGSYHNGSLPISDTIAHEWVEYDAQIVKVGKEVCQLLGVKSKLSRVSWRKWSPFVRVSSDDCIFAGGVLALAWWMRGRLTPSEWRPLMASSLIYNKRLFWTMTEDMAITMIMMVILGIGGIGLFFEILGTAGVLLYLILLFGPFLQYRFSQEKGKLKLKADVEAAKLLGTDAHLAVLEKIDSLRIDDMELRKKRRLSRYFSSSPSLTERIQNIGALRFDQAGPSAHGVET